MPPEESAESDFPARRASVAALTDKGPREVNEDRMFTSVSDDGAWVIAVADGLGGHARGDEAAEAAVRSLPDRIAGEAAMAAVFEAADERVLALSGPAGKQNRWAPLSTFPMSTLCVAAWTPEGGLLIGWMGDTIPFVVNSGPHGFWGYCCGLPHRGYFGAIESCLGMPPEQGGFPMDPAETEIIGGFEDDEMPDAVIIASDGVWEPLAIDYGGSEWLLDDSPSGVGSACPPDAADAMDIARGVLARARRLGLNDNATIAVAHLGTRQPAGSATPD